MKDIFRFVVAAALWVLGLALPGCLPSPPDVPFLASDAHFTIGGQHIIVPVVAMRQPDHTFNLASGRSRGIKEELQTKASDPAEPMKIEKINLLIRQYQYTGEHAASVGICPLLKRKWSETLCRGQHQGLLSRLPEKFDLLDRAKLDFLQSEFAVGRERVYDQVKDMALRPEVAEVLATGNPNSARPWLRFCRDCWPCGQCGTTIRPEAQLSKWPTPKVRPSYSSSTAR